MTRLTLPRLHSAGLLLAGTVLLAACGAATDATDRPEEATADVDLDWSGPDPSGGQGDAAPPAMGMCVPEVPDCVDTVVVPEGESDVLVDESRDYPVEQGPETPSR